MNFSEKINIVIAGEAGQGIETALDIITKILHYNDYNVFAVSEYMSRIRGGSNSALIKVSSEKSAFFESKIDVLFAMKSSALEHLKDRVTDKTISFDLKKKNFYVIGYICAILKIGLEDALNFLENHFEKFLKIESNASDFNTGYEEGKNNSDIVIDIPKNKDNDDDMLISGNDALGIGCIAGGCNFVPFYPMSPATFLHSFLTDNAQYFDMVSKQVEDEICVMNMALGAWYAGARAIASSSGGGFDLMCEGLSLAGITETPIVINIAQRPGPATGLPTRTGQEDLNVALYSGHGEFPRIVYAPATLEDSYIIGKISFDLADRFQVPVFILSDQGLLESIYACREFNCEANPTHYIVESDADYKRYALSENPIYTPRSVPNFGQGIVCVDSDEHDEVGYITEDFEMRNKMVNKRLGKLDEFTNNPAKYIYPHYFIGEKAYETLIVSWGSNFHVIEEAIKNKKDYALLHFMLVYPLDKSVLDYFAKAKRIVVIEQNATGQFANLLKCEFGIKASTKLLKYSGLPFSIEEVEAFLNEESNR